MGEQHGEIQRLGAASDASAAASSDAHAQHALELQRLRDAHGSEREEHLTKLDELTSELAKATRQLVEQDSEIQRLRAASDASAAASSDAHAHHALELQRLLDAHESEREEHLTKLDELTSELAKANAQVIEQGHEIQRLRAVSEASAVASSEVHAQHTLEKQRLLDPRERAGSGSSRVVQLSMFVMGHLSVFPRVRTFTRSTPWRCTRGTLASPMHKSVTVGWTKHPILHIPLRRT